MSINMDVFRQDDAEDDNNDNMCSQLNNGQCYCK